MKHLLTLALVGIILTLGCSKNSSTDDKEKPTDAGKQAGSQTDPQKPKDVIAAKDDVADWSIKQLLEQYDATEADNKLGRELKMRGKDKRFIVFKKDGTVDVKSSEFLFKELRKDFPERQWYEVAGTLCKTYKVGVEPEELLDENPLYPGQALRLDGTCQKTNRKWQGVPLLVRQVLYLAITDSKELKIDKVGDAHDILDKLKGKNAADSEAWLKERYPEAYRAYGEKKEQNQLPPLKISSGKLRSGKAMRQDDKNLLVERTAGEIVFKMGIRFSWIPPGTFMMGSPPNEIDRDVNETLHRVTLTKGFYMSTCPVTRGQFAKFIQKKGYTTQAEQNGDDKNWHRPGFLQTDQHPVVCISWNDSIAFCEWLSEQDKEGNKYRLPTEAEREYACRAETTTPFNTGNTISTNQANYCGDVTYGRGKRGVFRRTTTPVGSFPPNAWGLHDMHGNVSDWCSDWFGEYGKEAITKDPHGPPNGQRRVLRGGAQHNWPTHIRSAHRYSQKPDASSTESGLRVCFRIN